MWGTFAKSLVTVAATGAAALTGVALANDAYVYTRKKLVGGKSESSSKSKSKKKSKNKAKASKRHRNRNKKLNPAGKITKHAA